MTNHVCILHNENLSRRSFYKFQQSSIFSVCMSKCYLTELDHANRGLIKVHRNGTKEKFRTLPRANDPNWRIHSVYEFGSIQNARTAASIIQCNSVVPYILREVRNEIRKTEFIRNNIISIQSFKWNNLNSVRARPGLELDDFDLFLPDQFGDLDIEYQRIFDF